MKYLGSLELTVAFVLIILNHGVVSALPVILFLAGIVMVLFGDFFIHQSVPEVYKDIPIRAKFGRFTVYSKSEVYSLCPNSFIILKNGTNIQRRFGGQLDISNSDSPLYLLDQSAKQVYP